MRRRSGIPSPNFALTGTTAIFVVKSATRSYRSAEKPCSNKRPTSSYMRLSSSSRVEGGWSS